MMLRLKICTTVLFVYEIIAVILLYGARTCGALFGMNFCATGAFKYFIVCAAVPMIGAIIIMWVREIIHARRRRYSPISRAFGAARAVARNVRARVMEHIDQDDLEKLIAGALVVGLQRYTSRHASDAGEKSPAKKTSRRRRSQPKK